MSRRFGLLCLMILVAGMAPAGQDATACGDKYLVTGTGAAQFGPLANRYAGTILIFANRETGAAAALADPDFLKTLQAHGHSFGVVGEWSSLESALKEDPFDMILVDIADAESTRKMIVPISPDTLIVPVMYDAPRNEYKLAKRQYPHVLRTPARSGHLAMLIDVAMGDRKPS